jgi:hypothetical protein
MSTGGGIGTAIAGLMTVDVFKSLRRKKRPDTYYLRLTRLFASLSIICGTLFAMLIPRFGGMIPFYVAFTGTFFLPLTVPYVGGALYRKASRGSGMAALVAGIGLGTILFLGYEIPLSLDRPEWSLPTSLSQAQWRPFWVLGFTSLVFVGWSIMENRVKGPIPDTELASILNSHELGRTTGPDEVEQMIRSRTLRPWDGQANIDYHSVGIPRELPWYTHPTTFEGSIVVLLTVLMVWWW